MCTSLSTHFILYPLPHQILPFAVKTGWVRDSTRRLQKVDTPERSKGPRISESEWLESVGRDAAGIETISTGDMTIDQLRAEVERLSNEKAEAKKIRG